MANTPDAREFHERLQRLDVLLNEVGRFADPAAQAHTREIVRALLELHGAGLGRVLGHIHDAGAAGAAVLDACAADDLVGGLLLLHDLHPLGPEARVLRALDDVRPALRAHHGDVELISIVDGAVRLRLLGSCHGCPSSAVTMKQTVEEAILARAPDVTSVTVEDEPPAPTVAVTPDGRKRISLPVLS